MRLHYLILAVGLALLPFAPAPAQQKHRHSHAHDHKPQHGGLLMETGGLVYELKVTAGEITVWVTDEADKPVPTKGSTATLTLIASASSRLAVPLAAAGDNRFHATGSWDVRPGQSALLEVAIGGKVIAKLRYTLK